MRTFKLNKNYNIICEFEDEKDGFSHIAVLQKNGKLIGEETKVIYLNRTWERFEFETVLKKCIDNHFEGPEHKKFITKINNAGMNGEL